MKSEMLAAQHCSHPVVFSEHSLHNTAQNAPRQNLAPISPIPHDSLEQSNV